MVKIDRKSRENHRRSLFVRPETSPMEATQPFGAPAQSAGFAGAAALSSLGVGLVTWQKKVGI